MDFLGRVTKVQYSQWITNINYSNHLNSGLVWYSNGRCVSGCQMVWYSNGGLKTGLKKVLFGSNSLNLYPKERRFSTSLQSNVKVRLRHATSSRNLSSLFSADSVTRCGFLLWQTFLPKIAEIFGDFFGDFSIVKKYLYHSYGLSP